MTSETQKLEQAITALEAQRTVLGDTVVETVLMPLREKLKLLRATGDTALGALGVDTQQRKIVTVLFADIPGFASLTERLDAEDLRDTANALWAQLDAVILKHGGRIDKHMGNGVMALWGAEVVREDDAEQAIRAGLEMRAALEAFRRASPLLDAPDVREQINLRVGLNTGPVIVGLVGMTGEFTAIGDAVNLAARLNQSARPGELLTTYETYRLVRGVFDVALQPPLQVKGKAEPVQTYLVQRLKPRAFRAAMRGVEGVETPLVGRQIELQTLQAAYQRLFATPGLQLVTICGEMGLGKSRLLQEFTNWADALPEVWYWFQGRSHPSQTSTPYALLRDIFSFRFQIQDSDALVVVHKKMERGFAEFMPNDERAHEKAHIVGQLIGFDFSTSPYLRGILQDPKQMRSLGFATLARFFASAAESFPVILLADDLHWADRGSLDALTYIFENVPATTPILALCTARPQLFERYPEWGQGLPAAVQRDLKPLLPEQSQTLLAQILHKAAEIPSILRDLIVGGAEGNPFYLEELIKMLIDGRVIRPGDERWEIDLARLDVSSIPPTLAGVLQARLDRLDMFERASLQRASVVGRVFWDSAVKALSSDVQAEQQLLDKSLNLLRAKELIFTSPVSTFYGAQEYSFKHAMLRDVTYDTVLKRQRMQYHSRVADWLSSASGERRGEYLSVIADHYEKAGENDKAVSVLLEAGERALGVSAFDEAFRFFQRALPLTDARLRRDLAHLHLKIGEAFFRSGEYADSLKSTEKALAFARELSSSIMLASCLNQIGQLHAERGDYAQAERYLLQALPMARAAGIPARPTLAQVLYGLGNVYWRLGSLEKARDFCLESRELSSQIGETNTLLMAINRLGVVTGSLGDSVAEEGYYKQAQALAISVGNRERAAVALNNLGALADEKGDLRKAQEYYLQAIDMAREIGAQQSLALYLINLGYSEMRLGQFDVAAEHLREGLALSDHLGAAPWAVTAVLFFAHLAYLRGQAERAFALLGLSRSQPAFSSDHQRLMDQMFADWKIAPETVADQVQAGEALDWKKVVLELMTGI